MYLRVQHKFKVWHTNYYEANKYKVKLTHDSLQILFPPCSHVPETSLQQIKQLQWDSEREDACSRLKWSFLTCMMSQTEWMCWQLVEYVCRQFQGKLDHCHDGRGNAHLLHNEPLVMARLSRLWLVEAGLVGLLWWNTNSFSTYKKSLLESMADDQCFLPLFDIL